MTQQCSVCSSQGWRSDEGFRIIQTHQSGFSMNSDQLKPLLCCWPYLWSLPAGRQATMVFVFLTKPFSGNPLKVHTVSRHWPCSSITQLCAFEWRGVSAAAVIKVFLLYHTSPLGLNYTDRYHQLDRYLPHHAALPSFWRPFTEIPVEIRAACRVLTHLNAPV